MRSFGTLLLAVPIAAGFSRLRYRPHDVTTGSGSSWKRPPTASASSSSSEESNNNNDLLLESLRARQQVLQQEQADLHQRWQTADCTSRIPVVLLDWVRRLSVDYPLVACGSAQGNVYLSNLETGDILAVGTLPDARDEFLQAPEMERVSRIVFNGFDGGGTLSIALQGKCLWEGRRSGGLHLWRLDRRGVQQSLVAQGQIPALEGAFVTALALEDEDHLWVGTADGRLQAYAIEDDENLPKTSEPAMEWTFGTSTVVLSIATSPVHACGAVALSTGQVVLVSLDDADAGKVLGSLDPPFDSMERKSMHAFPLSVAFVEGSAAADGAVTTTQEEARPSLSIACGGNDGSLFVQPIALTSTGQIDTHQPFRKDAPLTPLRPRHRGPVKCLASPRPGMLLSAGLDGSLRVWNLETHKADDSGLLYQFLGYKVWLGGLWTDGRRIVSDGADNTVILHDFTKGSDL
jgi:WD40 repeat protein